MRACLAFLLAMTLLQAVGFIAYANVRLDAVPATTQTTEMVGIEKILDILAPVNVRKPDRRIERSFQDFSAWREQLFYQKQSASHAATTHPARPRTLNQRAY